MSIDYDRLRELLRIAGGDRGVRDYATEHDAERELENLAPDMARELLLLRDGVEKVRKMCLRERNAAFHATPMRADEVEAFNLCAERLTDLLEGDTK